MALGVTMSTVGGRQREGGLLRGSEIWLPLIRPETACCVNGHLSAEGSGFPTCLGQWKQRGKKQSRPLNQKEICQASGAGGAD